MDGCPKPGIGPVLVRRYGEAALLSEEFLSGYCHMLWTDM